MKAGHKDGHGQVVLLSSGMVVLRGHFLPAIVGTAARRPVSDMDTGEIIGEKEKVRILGVGGSPAVRARHGLVGEVLRDGDQVCVHGSNEETEHSIAVAWIQ